MSYIFWSAALIKTTVEILLRCADDIKKQIIIVSPVYLINQQRTALILDSLKI